MLKFIFFILIFSTQAYSFRPADKSEIFISKESADKALECGRRYINFLGNHFIFEKAAESYESTCSCDDIDRRKLQIYSNYRQIMGQYLSYSHVACSKNIWLCVNPTREKKLEEARSADEYCRLVDELIDQKFKTPFSSEQLKAASLELLPLFNIPKYQWGRAACEKLLPLAKLHPKCNLGGGMGVGAGAVGSEKREAEEIKALH